MKERKIIIITVIIAVVVSLVFIAIFLLFTNNTSNNTPVIDNTENPIQEDNSSSDTSSETSKTESQSRPSQQGNTDMFELRASDPIYEYVGSGYESTNYTLGFTVNPQLERVITIIIHSSEPTTTQGRATVEQYKNEALQKIRDWGFNPDDYTVTVKYRY